MLTGLVQHASKIKFLLNDHSVTLLTAAGVGGTVATAYLTGRASFRAADIIGKEKSIINTAVEENQDPVRLSKTETFQLVWMQYIPPAAMGILTITCIITANRISSKKIAALVVASGVSERAFQEYKDKVVEKLGVRQDQKIRDEVAQDRVLANPANSREIILAGTGEVLCYDMLTGRYFQSTMEEIKRAENRVNYELIHFMSASLSMFYEEIGLPPTDYTDSVGWNMNNKMEVQFSTVLSQDQRPCLAIGFSQPPVPNYDKHYE
jgi:Family of unknown function (DUF6353)